MYELRVARSARKELDRLPDAVIARVARQLDALPSEPRPHGCKKLRGASDLWRIRVGAYRIVYRVDDSEKLIEIRAIRDRKDAYG
jgi:mRNA interferase RelE/StbE